MLRYCKHEHVSNPQPFLLFLSLANVLTNAHLFLLALGRSSTLTSTIVCDVWLTMELFLGLIILLINNLFLLFINLVELIDDCTAVKVFLINFLFSRWFSFGRWYLSRMLRSLLCMLLAWPTWTLAVFVRILDIPITGNNILAFISTLIMLSLFYWLSAFSVYHFWFWRTNFQTL